MYARQQPASQPLSPNLFSTNRDMIIAFHGQEQTVDFRNGGLSSPVLQYHLAEVLKKQEAAAGRFQ